MEHWQVAIYSIGAFTAMCATLLGIASVRHYTKKEVDQRFDEIKERQRLKGKEYVEVKVCDGFHNTQNVRNESFTNTMVRLGDEISNMFNDFSKRMDNFDSKLDNLKDSVSRVIIENELRNK